MLISGSKLSFGNELPQTELPDLLCDFGKLLPSAGAPAALVHLVVAGGPRDGEWSFLRTPCFC